MRTPRLLLQRRGATSVSARARTFAWIARIGAGVGLVVSFGAGTASAGLWDTARILEHNGNECAGQINDCRSVVSGPVEIAGNGEDSIKVKCPARFPYLVGWDTEQNEFLHARRVSSDPDQVTPKQTADSLTVAVTSKVDTVGTIQVYVGCARRRANGTSLMSGRIGVPANHVGFTGGEK
jgi:hypothetical protein